MLVICPVSELAPRVQARRVGQPDIGDPAIAVFHTEDGEILAIDDTCSHQQASLADGWLEGCEIECPLHSSRFDCDWSRGRTSRPPAGADPPRS